MRSFTFKLFLLITVFILSITNIFAQYTWQKYSDNPLNIHGTTGSWDWSVVTPAVIFNSDSNRYEMWYTSYSGSFPNGGVGFAYSTDGITWTKNPAAVMTPGAAGWDSLFVGAACVLKEGGNYKMWYTGWNSATRYPHSIGYATSMDGINWTKHPSPVLSPLTGWESGAVGYPSVIKVGSSYVMFYTGEISVGVALTGRAVSTDGVTWERYSNNPVLPAGGVGQWDRNNYLGKVIQIENTLYIYYTGESNPGVSGSAIGMASSNDTGKTWIKYSGNPVITRGASGSWDNGWIESGSILFTQNELRFYYDGGATSGGRIGLATSPYIVPVELTSFTATSNGKEVLLNWSTASELNNYGFEIQRSSNEKDFFTIGFVSGNGTTTEQQNYSYTDKNLLDGKNYYRLKQIDYGGSFEYSDVIEVEWRAFDTYLLEQNFPNPFNPLTTIGYGIKEKGNVKMTVVNAIGEEVAVLVNEEKEAGYHTVEFNASTLPSGIYFYQLKAGEYVAVKKMILIK
jgi:hypothetical protein